MPDPDPVRMIDTRNIYQTGRLRLSVERFQTPDGEVERPAIHHPGSVAMIALPAPGTLMLVRQYRYPLRRWTLEIPAGTREPNENPLVCARRELAEEAGLTCRRLVERLRMFPAAGLLDEEMILYEAQDLSPVPTNPDHGELVRPEPTAFAALPDLIAQGLILDAKTFLALALLGLWPKVPPC